VAPSAETIFALASSPVPRAQAAAAADTGVGGAPGSVAGLGGNGAASGAAGNVTGGQNSGGAGGAGPFFIHASAANTLCPGQSYQIELNATGGIPPFSWALADGSPTTLQLSATTGATIQVSGLASKPQPNLQVSAQDSSGSAVTTEIALTIGAVGPGECPQITPAQLPNPCSENAYHSDEVTVTGGTAPFVWQALSIPEGLTFDTALQVLGGTAMPAGASTPLTLQVSDSKGRQTQMTYPLLYRDRCWLGYTSAANGSQIHLYDPGLRASVPVARRLG